MPRTQASPALTREVIAALPKSDLHLHLDGSLRELVFKRAYKNLPEYLKGFEFTVACLQDAESLERAAYELCLDCRSENVFYIEVRFAPQLHVRGEFNV